MTKMKNGPKNILVGVLIAATIFLISLLFPKEERLNYVFDQGEKWAHETVQAEQDFYVWKSASEIKAEQESVRIDYRPLFYRVNDKSAYHNRWINHLQRNRDLLSVQDYKRASEYLQSIKGKEVIKSEDLTLDKKLYNKVRLKSGNSIVEIRPEDYVTIESLVSGMRPLTTIVPDYDLYDIITSELNQQDSKDELTFYLEAITAYKRKILKGETIISTGDVVDTKAYESLSSLMLAQKEDRLNASITFVGFLLLTCLIIGVYVLYLLFHYPETFESPSKISFMMLLILTMSFLVYSVDGTDNLSTYMIPFCIVPIIMKSFFSDRLALFTHIVVVLIASFLSVLDYEFTFLQILAGIVAVLVIEDTRSWNKFFISIFLSLIHI